MNSKDKLLKDIVEYYRVNVFNNSIEASLNKHSKLKEYNINPIVLKYLSIVIEGQYNPEGVAKALYYPRVLSTSINTSFGTRSQSMFVELGIAQGSLIKGMDIEFVDKLDNRKKWCQLKAEPNTINSGDVDPLIKNFTDIINLARTNMAFFGINNTDFVIGVIYGDASELSMHYKKIDAVYPVIIGKDLWHRVTGYQDFYEQLISELHNTILNLDTKDFFRIGCEKLAEEIRNSPVFEF